MSDMSALEPLLDLQTVLLQVQKDILDDTTQQKIIWPTDVSSDALKERLEECETRLPLKLNEIYNADIYLYYDEAPHQTEDESTERQTRIFKTFVIAEKAWWVIGREHPYRHMVLTGIHDQLVLLDLYKQIELYFYHDELYHIPVDISTTLFLYPDRSEESWLLNCLEYKRYSECFRPKALIDPRKGYNMDAVLLVCDIMHSYEMRDRNVVLSYQEPISYRLLFSRKQEDMFCPTNMYFTCWESCVQYGRAFSRYMWEALIDSYKQEGLVDV